jgi:hypothetical protein
MAVQTEQTASTDEMSAVMESILRCNAGLLQKFTASVIRRCIRTGKREVIQKS